MRRIVCSVLAAGAAALAAAAPAHAEGLREERRETFAARTASAIERRHEREWAELMRVRHRFYARWNGNPRERARFERWYARRCEELRRS